MKTCAPISKENLNGLRNFNNRARIKKIIYHSSLLCEEINGLNINLLKNCDTEFIARMSRNLDYLREIMGKVD